MFTRVLYITSTRVRSFGIPKAGYSVYAPAVSSRKCTQPSKQKDAPPREDASFFLPLYIDYNKAISSSTDIIFCSPVIIFLRLILPCSLSVSPTMAT